MRNVGLPEIVDSRRDRDNGKHPYPHFQAMWPPLLTFQKDPDMTSTDLLLAFHAVRVRPTAADFRSVAVPRSSPHLAVLEGWRLIPWGCPQEVEMLLAFVLLPRSRGHGSRLIRVPELEGRRVPSGAPFKGWTYLDRLPDIHFTLEFDRKFRCRPPMVSAHQVAARAQQLRRTFPPIDEELNFTGLCDEARNFRTPPSLAGGAQSERAQAKEAR